MKKIFVAILALAAAACSNEEIVSVNREAIGFDNAFINNSVRSVVDPSFTNTNLFENFAVYGYVTEEGTGTLFDGTQVSGSALNGEWTYTGTQYWIEGATYNFYAVAPNSYKGYWMASTSNVNGLVLSVQNTDGTKDILVAKANDIVGKASGQNVPVAFNFQHILSKVKFSFTNNYDATDSSIRVENIKINNACRASFVTLSKNNLEWGNGDGSQTTLNFGNAAVASATAEEAFTNGTTVESYNERLLIPVAVNGGYNVTFDVKVLVNGVVVKTYSHDVNVDFTPVAGHSYNIAATIEAENINPDEELDPIEFTVTSISDWANGNTADSDDDDVNDSLPLPLN